MASQRETDRWMVRAPAKLNLCLELIRRRSDGFHELRTVISTLKIWDTLSLKVLAAPDLRLSVTGPSASLDVPSDSSNLVVRALQELQSLSGSQLGAQVALRKQIPSQAGLGGGSSNAAAALVVGNQAWDLGLSIQQLADLGAKLGSDIPFFVQAMASPCFGRRATTALCTGRGELVQPLEVPAGIPVVLVKPAGGLSTADVYRACRTTDYADEPNRCERLLEHLALGHRLGLGSRLHNTLQIAAERVSQSIQSLRQWFEKLPVLGHQLSGSGSAYFAICRSMAEARKIASLTRAAGIGRVWVASTG